MMFVASMISLNEEEYIERALNSLWFVDKVTPKERKFILITSDSVLTCCSLILAYALLNSVAKIPFFLLNYGWLLPLFITVRIFTFYYNDIYVFLWRYASIRELTSLVKAITISSVIIMATMYLFDNAGLPESVLIMDWTLNLILIGSTRLILRLLRDYLIARQVKPSISKGKKNLIIIGAGDAGVMIAREIHRVSSLPYNVIGFIDDKKNKKGQIIHSLPVLGASSDFFNIVKHHKIEEAIIAIPSAKGTDIRNFVNMCQEAKLHFKITPGLYNIIDGKVSVSQLREVRIEDLLGRDVVEVEIDIISKYLENSCVLVTGAGGSIGSELCRQILKFAPQKLILLDHSENNLYTIESELKGNKDTQIIPVIADVKNKHRLQKLFTQHKPHVIFHAAAYKHVPLMEENVEEVIQNNIRGTQNILDVASEYKAKEVVMVSTDKAVYPNNCMGASKRIGELLMQHQALKYPETKFTAVRFGNVLGSHGSVVPLFKKQIEKGGPVTITHPDITRFFMTIQEAVQMSLCRQENPNILFR